METILVIDDSAVVVAALRMHLSAGGFAVVGLTEGKMAQRQMAEMAPDLVITDVFMPEIDGIELVGWMRKSHPNIPVIVMTGSGDPIYKSLGAKLGAKAVLQKPISAHTLLACVRDALSVASGEQLEE